MTYVLQASDMWALHALWWCIALASRPKNKYFHQNKGKCDALFQWLIDDVPCWETLHQSWVFFMLAGERDYLFMSSDVRRYRLRQARWLTYLKTCLAKLSHILEIVSMSTINYWKRSINTILSDITPLMMPELESPTTVESLKACIDPIIPYFV